MKFGNYVITLKADRKIVSDPQYMEIIQQSYDWASLSK